MITLAPHVIASSLSEKKRQRMTREFGEDNWINDQSKQSQNLHSHAYYIIYDAPLNVKRSSQKMFFHSKYASEKKEI